MADKSILANLSGLRAEFLGLDEVEMVDPASDLYACGFDSLSLFNFLLQVEERFAFRIPDESFNYRNLSTIGDVVAVIDAHAPANAAMS